VSEELNFFVCLFLSPLSGKKLSSFPTGTSWTSLFIGITLKENVLIERRHWRLDTFKYHQNETKVSMYLYLMLTILVFLDACCRKVDWRFVMNVMLQEYWYCVNIGLLCGDWSSCYKYVLLYSILALPNRHNVIMIKLFDWIIKASTFNNRMLWIFSTVCERHNRALLFQSPFPIKNFCIKFKIWKGNFITLHFDDNLNWKRNSYIKLIFT